MSLREAVLSCGGTEAAGECELTVPSWLPALTAARDAGATYFDWLGATSESGGWIRVSAHVMTPDAADRLLVHVLVPPGQPLESLCDVYPSAAWHEHEAAELVGARFNPAPTGPLFTPPGSSGHPLARTTGLLARLDRSWPGAYQPGSDSGRRSRAPRVPGVPAEWGDRE